MQGVCAVRNALRNVQHIYEGDILSAPGGVRPLRYACSSRAGVRWLPGCIKRRGHHSGWRNRNVPRARKGRREKSVGGCWMRVIPLHRGIWAGCKKKTPRT